MIYVCGSQEIINLIAKIDREVRGSEASVVYQGLETDVLKSNQTMIFKTSDGAGIKLY